MEIDPKDISNFSLLPMCLHMNKKERMYKITNPYAVKEHDKFYLKCLKYDFLKKDNIEDYEIKPFYTVVPSFRPIPTGMYLFCITSEEDFPYRNLSLKLIYDPFENSSNCISFIAYNLPTPYTVPIYLHKLGGILYPTFYKKPPFPSNDWIEQEFSPIYVIPEYIGKIPGYKIGFSCYDDWRCNPDINSKDDITNCVLSCNLFSENNPKTIFDIKPGVYNWKLITIILIVIIIHVIIIKLIKPLKLIKLLLKPRN